MSFDILLMIVIPALIFQWAAVLFTLPYAIESWPAFKTWGEGAGAVLLCTIIAIGCTILRGLP